jgi:hypothetical protein
MEGNLKKKSYFINYANACTPRNENISIRFYSWWYATKYFKPYVSV